uniref:Uncharacterized protein n=1 Tax=Ailuropoda melanoleuca TaxID=9646 RepID=A0A7N5JMZ8_AILME
MDCSSTLTCTVAGIIETLWGCIVYLPAFFISELNFLHVSLLHITSRFRLVKEQV